MSERTIKVVKPAYEITVGDFFAVFAKAPAASSKPEFDTEIYRMPVVKKMEVEPDASTNKIYASGVVYDTTTQVRGGKGTLAAVALPQEFLDKALGSQGKPGVQYDTSLPQQPEFLCGYTCTMSDGAEVYYIHPRCKLTMGSESHATLEEGDVDPEVSVTLEMLPTFEGVWKGRYYPAKAGDHPKTKEEFFKALPYTKAELDALVAGG